MLLSARSLFATCAVLLGFFFLCASADPKCFNQVGFWDKMDMWQSADYACPLKDLIGPPSAESLPARPGAVRLLMFGDSNDRYIAHDQCKVVEEHSHGPTTIKHCERGILSISWQAMVGVHPHGPWWGGETGTPRERLEHGFAAHREAYHADLDIVTFSSSLWDLSRWSDLEGALDGSQIKEGLLREWSLHLLESLKVIEARAPKETLLIFRTGAPGAWGACDTNSTYTLNIKKSHMCQLNAAAKAVLQRRPRWHVLDLEQMVAQFECPQDYLRDFLHLNERLTWTVLNQYINMLHTFWEEHGFPEWRQSASAFSSRRRLVEGYHLPEFIRQALVPM